MRSIAFCFDCAMDVLVGTARRYPGNYTNFIARKKENYDKQMKDHIAQQKEIERMVIADCKL